MTEPGGRAPGPFEEHLREAIALNSTRAPLYATLSAGRSRRISRTLLWSERALLPVARWFDRRAEPYHRAGIPLLHDVFVSMEGTPAFLPRLGPVPGPPRLRPDGRAAGREVARAFRAAGFDGAAATLARHLGALEEEPEFHCMLRHLLESTRRIALVAPGLHRLAGRRGLASPLPLLSRLLRVHLWGCGAAGRLDRLALPLQADGLPILCRDVPPIPPYP
jgi:hypothetical protein